MKKLEVWKEAVKLSKKKYSVTENFGLTIEILSQLIVSRDLNFLNEEDYLKLRNTIYKISNMLNSLRKLQLND
ncbi:four helix bundle protein [Tenacibaculum sp. FZY0031]|uniref:four helix bundle protein n=1 Tax=Tenacibaculum sp. FZY0031 TaxID=3116648 RepID=UPI002EC89872|nr:four helix bundle protein [Tenacibaculum sp. FZY0031]